MPIGNNIKPFVRILPERHVARGNGLLELVYINFNAISRNALVFAENIKKRTIAAADINDLCRWRHHIAYALEKAALRVHHLGRARIEEARHET